MDQTNNYKRKINVSKSNDASSAPSIQLTYKKRIRCNECHKKRKASDENHQICHICYKAKKTLKQSGIKVIDDFIRHTQINYSKQVGRMEFVPYDQFRNIEFIAEGGFSKVYKAIWVDGPIKNVKNQSKSHNYAVTLKKIKNSKNITSKELNEVRIKFILHQFKFKIK